MGDFEIVESETVKVALKVLDKLLVDNVSKQVYAKEIRMLFDLISVQQTPPLLCKEANLDKGEKNE